MLIAMSQPAGAHAMKSHRRLFLSAAAATLALPAWARDAAPTAGPALDARVQAFLDSKRGEWRRGVNLWNVSEGGARVMHDLVVQRGHRRILDIGTSTGHSALWLAWAASKTGGRVTTIEIDPGRHAEALRNFREAGLDGFIDARLGDAHELVKQLPGPWDFVFQDADKDWSLNYWNALKDKLSPRACYAVDHVMHSRSPGIRGFVESAQGDARFEHRVHDMGGGDLFVVCGKG